MLMKFLRGNWTGWITVIGIILCLIIIFSGTDAMYVLVVLGAVNILYGLYSILTGKPLTKNSYEHLENPTKFIRMQGIYQIGMGVFVLLMGIIYVTEFVPGKYFYDILLVGLVIIMIGWFWLNRKAKREVK